jgi:small-conductance mechanosensitive channel
MRAFSRILVPLATLLFGARARAEQSSAPAIEGWLPDVFSRARLWELALWQWIGLGVALLLGYLGGVFVGWVLLKLGGRIVARTAVDWDDRLLALARGPTRALLTIIIAWMLIEALALSAAAQDIVNKVLSVAMIAAIGWYGLRAMRFVAELIVGRAERRKDAYDELSLRNLRTQVVVLRRVLSVIVFVLAGGAMLMQFDEARTVGTSLLTSAGIAGIVLGLAAQRSIGTLLAGIQLSITRPVRIGDTVFLENELGTVEEIHLTYVSVKLWDHRRLIVPTNKFLDTSFQNHTKVATDQFLGHVVLHADYEIPVARVREELERILEESPRWDRKEKELVVLESTERTLQLRAQVSAANAKDLFALRCEVRERLIAFIHGLERGRYLPRTRMGEDAR